MSAPRIDHIVYAVADLDVAGARFSAEFGLGSLAGGIHPGWGTANRIVPLGRDYVELVAVVDPTAAAASAFGRAITAALQAGRPLAGWAVATDDLEGVAQRLALPVAAGSRRRPDGSLLRWRLAGVDGAPSSGALPFFIEWDCAPELHPGAAAAGHRVMPAGIAWVEVGGDRASLDRWAGRSAPAGARRRRGARAQVSRRGYRRRRDRPALRRACSERARTKRAATPAGQPVYAGPAGQRVYAGAATSSIESWRLAQHAVGMSGRRTTTAASVGPGTPGITASRGPASLTPSWRHKRPRCRPWRRSSPRPEPPSNKDVRFRRPTTLAPRQGLSAEPGTCWKASAHKPGVAEK